MSVYNDEGFLREAVESILNQTFADFEFLIIDDGSTDSTPYILQEYAGRDIRIRVVTNKRNIGLTKSLNKGLTLACGKYIARQDADDLSAHNRLSDQLHYLHQHPDCVLLGSFYEVLRLDDNTVYKASPPEDHFDIGVLMLIENSFAHSSVVFRKLPSVLYDEEYSYSQDYELWTRYYFWGSVANLPQVLIRHRKYDGSVSSLFADEQKANAHKTAIKFRNKCFRQGRWDILFAERLRRKAGPNIYLDDHDFIKVASVSEETRNKFLDLFETEAVGMMRLMNNCRLLIRCVGLRSFILKVFKTISTLLAVRISARLKGVQKTS